MPNETQQNYVKKVTVNLFSGIFSETINFESGLNIIAGENGTGKSEFLKYINNQRNSTNVEFSDVSILKDVAIFSPKRNTERKAIEAAYEIVQRDPSIRKTTLNAIKNYNVQDHQYQPIKSIAEYIASKAKDLVETDISIVEAHKKVQDENQLILEKVFDYKINFTWNTDSRRPSFTINKLNFDLTPSQLSEGETALISLFFAIFDAKDDIQVFLIDEPEVHLNWQLEEKLFKALDWFCTTYDKQIILVTHSRACFIKPFIQKTQFFVWDNGKIISTSKPNDKISKLLAGDLVKIIGGVTTENKIAYVEDKIHELVLSEIKSLMDISLEISILGRCSEVKKFSQAFKNLSVGNAYFLIDGDNNKVTTIDLSSKYSNLIQLKKYCIQNYFLDKTVITQIDQRTNKTKPVKDLINESIKQASDIRFKPLKVLIENDIELEPSLLDTIDASGFVKILAHSLGFTNEKAYLKEYLKYLGENDLLKTTFSEFYSNLFE